MVLKSPTTTEIRKIIEDVKDENYRYALMYQFLVGGHRSEVCGIYEPCGTDVFRHNFPINGERINAVIFQVKSARREGKIRLCALPLDKEYEPWSKPVFEWFRKHGKEPPFIFSESAKGTWSNQQYLSYITKKIFKKYNIPRHTKNFIRNARKNNLKKFYDFDSLELAIFGSWNDPPDYPITKNDIESILSTKQEKKKSELIKMTETYFKKLLIPIRQLELEDLPKYKKIRDIDSQSRSQRANKISKLIMDINRYTTVKYQTPLFKEIKRFFIEIQSRCENEHQWTTKIALLASIFEVGLKSIKNIIEGPSNQGYFQTLKRWFDQNDVSYNPSMFETWSKIKRLRNRLPIHAKNDDHELYEIFSYFGVPWEVSINYSRLWDKILFKFEISLNDLKDILDSLS